MVQKYKEVTVPMNLLKQMYLAPNSFERHELDLMEISITINKKLVEVKEEYEALAPKYADHLWKYQIYATSQQNGATSKSVSELFNYHSIFDNVRRFIGLVKSVDSLTVFIPMDKIEDYSSSKSSS